MKKKTVQPAYHKMTHPELVAAYNAMADLPIVKETNNPRYRPVHKFADNIVGTRRCELLASTIRALEQNVKEGKKNKIYPKQIDVKKLVEDEDEVPGSVEAVNGKAHRAKLFQQFRLRKGTLREVIIAGLVKNLNKWVARKTLLQAAYGSDKKKFTNALNMVLYSTEMLIKQRKIPLILCTDIKYEEKVYGLFETNRT